MLILKCNAKDCKGHLVGWNNKGEAKLLPNRDHAPTPIKITDEIRKKLEAERGSEPFATFMDVVEKEGKK